jgi:hypothetical protein
MQVFMSFTAVHYRRKSIFPPHKISRTAVNKNPA